MVTREGQRRDVFILQTDSAQLSSDGYKMKVRGESAVSTANIVAILKSLMRTVIHITSKLYL